MNKWGIHPPNGDIQDESIFDLGVSHFTLLHFQDKYLARLRNVSPDGIILVRFFLPNWSDRDPREWARECASIYNQRGYAQLRVHVTPANEMNLPGEGGGWSAEDYRRINVWLLAWIDEFQLLTGCPTERTHWPALAYGHSDDQDDYGYVGMEICRPSIERYGILDVHPYWGEPHQIQEEFYGHRFIKAHELFPETLIFCSETGNFAVDRDSAPAEIVQWFESLYAFDYVLGGTPFIWEDPTKHHQQNDWSRNPKIKEAVRNAFKGPARWPHAGVTPSPVPAPAPTPGGTMPTLYEEWFNTPGNVGPRTGPDGYERFKEHASRVAPGRDPFALGFPRFGENLATQKIDEIQQMLNELRGLVQ